MCYIDWLSAAWFGWPLDWLVDCYVCRLDLGGLHSRVGATRCYSPWDLLNSNCSWWLLRKTQLRKLICTGSGWTRAKEAKKMVPFWYHLIPLTSIHAWFTFTGLLYAWLLRTTLSIVAELCRNTRAYHYSKSVCRANQSVSSNTSLLEASCKLYERFMSNLPVKYKHTHTQTTVIIHLYSPSTYDVFKF